jgi:acylphosphatase
MADEDALEKAFRFHGRVQGVGFRWWTRSQAQRLGLAGTVRNRDDGTVEVQVRGSSRDVAHFLQLLQEGPPGAHVTELEELPAKQMPHDRFTILH